jgi:subfamily B ATP-binding cassette protein MsbA
LLSVISVSLIKPIIEIIFEQNVALENQIPDNFSNFFSEIKDRFFNNVAIIIKSENGDLFATLLRVGILIFLIFLLKNVVKYISVIISCKLEESIIKHIRDTIFKKINSLSIDFFNKNKLGNLISIITNDVSIVNSATINSFSVFIRDFFQIIFYLFFLFAISIKLTLITFAAGIFIILIVQFAIKYLRKYASRMQKAMANFTSTMSEIIAGMRAVKAFNGEKNANKKFQEDTKFYVKSSVKHQKVNALIPVLSELAAIGALCVVLLQGGALILDNSLSPSDLMLFLFAVFSIMSPITIVTNSVAQFQRGFVAAERIFGVLEQEPSVKNGNIKLLEFKKSIELKNLSFRYEENYVLKNINLKIEKGKQIAFVGGSGSGKSTMLDLIIRFYDPTEGEILIDGINLKELDSESYRSLFGIVSQENILFNDTVKNNIAFGFQDFSEEDLQNSAKISNSYKFIEKMPDGFDTFLGDRGVNISGGERQRIAIARALLRKPQILIFDEATSALDAESEKIVQGAINNSLENKTAILVAHRLSTIINCDLIVVFENGRIVEQGNHSQLLEKNGYYANLYNLQYKHNLGIS